MNDKQLLQRIKDIIWSNIYYYDEMFGREDAAEEILKLIKEIQHEETTHN